MKAVPGEAPAGQDVVRSVRTTRVREQISVSNGWSSMPKMKSNRAAMKRFKKTGTGKIRRRKAYKSHILTSKSAKRKRRLRKGALVDAADAPRVDRMLSE